MSGASSDRDWSTLLEAAAGALRTAYAPYSGFRVGAAVLTSDERIVTGSNVENASYGLTICAERVAVFRAIAEGDRGRLGIDALAIVTDPEVPGPPCGACRQVISEFGREAVVSFVAEGGRIERPISELLPYGFTLGPGDS